MKKFTLAIAILASVLTVSAQDLMVNGGFESWADASTPAANWTPTIAVNQTYSKESTIVHSGSFSLKSTYGAKGPSGSVTTGKMITKPYMTITAGKTYTFSFWYYTDAATTNLAGGLRMWGYWENPDGSNGSFDQKNLQPTEYINLTSSVGQWQQFSVDVTAPAGSGQIEVDIRFYNSATVYIDDVQFGEKGTLGVNPTRANGDFYLSNKTLQNVVPGTTVQVYNAVGKQVLRVISSSKGVDLSGVSNGIYIVRVGKISKKIIL